MSVKLKLILIIGVLLVCTVAVSVFFIRQNSINILNERAKISDAEKVDYVKQLVSIYMYNAEATLTNLSNDPDMVAALEKGDAGIVSLVSEKLTATQKTAGIFENIALHEVNITTCTVRSVTQDSLSLIGRDFSSRDYCQGIIKTQAPYISGVFNSAVTNNLVLGVAVPVNNAQKKIIGYIVGIVDLSKLRGYIWDLQSQGNFVILLDRYGQIILDTRDQDEQKFLMSDVISYINNNKAFSGFINPQDYFVSFKRIDFVTAILFEPSILGYNAINQTSFTIIIVNILLVVLLIFVIYFVISYFINRLHAIVIVAQENTKSKEIKKVDEKYTKVNDELGVLAKAFNQMLDALREARFSLEKKVKERTDKLLQSEKQIKKTLEDAERANKLMVGRELKMIELKKLLKDKQDEN